MTKDTKPVNKIYYGPPGTGKTYKLNEIKKAYERWGDFYKDKTGWCPLALAIWDEREPKVLKELCQNRFILAYAEYGSDAQDISQTLSVALQSHCSPDLNPNYNGNRGKPTIFRKEKEGNNAKWSFVDNAEKKDKKALNDLIEEAKTFLNSSHDCFEFVTFHQAYSYEDFVEGIRPVTDEKNGITYKTQPGVFKRLCEKAHKNPNHRYAIFIDEINRGNIAKIFGELITLVEIDKRTRPGTDEKGTVTHEGGMSLTLPYSGERFSVPSNLDIYGSMNTADRSIALLDTALRRRFIFEELMPDPEAIEGNGDGKIKVKRGDDIDLRAMLTSMNERITVLRGRDLTLGHAYLCHVTNFEELTVVIREQFIPLLQEYFYDDWSKLQVIFNDSGAAEENQIINCEDVDLRKLGIPNDYGEKIKNYKIADVITEDAIRKIYQRDDEIT